MAPISFINLLALELLRLPHHVEELRAVAVLIAAEAALGQLEVGGVGEVAFVLRVPQQQAEAGDGGGELEVVRRLGERLAVVGDRPFELLARVAVGLLCSAS